jgi:hypothetical protein
VAFVIDCNNLKRRRVEFPFSLHGSCCVRLAGVQLELFTGCHEALYSMCMDTRTVYGQCMQKSVAVDALNDSCMGL